MKAWVSRTALEWATIAGDSPVRERSSPPVWHLSRTGHVEAGSNPRGPSRKAKYSPATDSVPSSASERWEERIPGEDSEPETTCLQAVGAPLTMANPKPAIRNPNSDRLRALGFRFSTWRLPFALV